MKQITVVDFKQIINDEDIFLVDVRNPNEFELANIGGALIPLPELESRFNEIPKDKKIYCLCHHGMRSAYACQFLASQGFENVVNISGGIDAWSLYVDPTVDRY